MNKFLFIRFRLIEELLFLVIKEEPLKTAKAFLYMTTGGKGVSNMTRSSIVNSVHYYGIERLNGVIMQEVNEGNEKKYHNPTA